MQDGLLRFGPFELDPEKEELKRAGLVLRLPRQPFRILLLLLQRAGGVVTREEIREAIWGNEKYVDFEHGINSAIREIRFVLGDHAETPKYIRTLPRRGYSFVATIERVARPGPGVSEPPPTIKRKAWRLPAIAATILIAIAAVVFLVVQSRRSPNPVRPSGRSIAVHSFRRLGPAIAGVDERSFAEELRATIGRLPRQRVSVIEGAGPADVVIDGTIRQAENGVRVIVSVTDPRTQTRIWSNTFHRPFAKKEGMAVEVAHQVMHEIARRYLPPARHEPLLLTKASPSAIALYRRARLLETRSQGYDWMRTRELYEQALREDPRQAEAWSGLSDLWTRQALFGPIAECDHAAAQATEFARKALALQPRNPEAHSALGLLAAQRDFDLAGAEESLRRATTADPTYVDARANLAMVLAMRGQTEESLREFAAARELDPITLDLAPLEAQLYFWARRYEDARARYREILAMTPESGPAIWGVMASYIIQKNWGEAIATARRLPQFASVPDDVPPTEAGFMQMYRGFEPFLLEGHRRGRFNPYFMAQYYGQRGEPDKAFKYLNQAVDIRVPMVSYIMVDPRVDTLRTDPRFRALLARMHLGRPPQVLRAMK